MSTRHFAVSPSPFVDLPNADAFRLQNFLTSAANEYADAELAHDAFHEAVVVRDQEHTNMFATYMPGPMDAHIRARRFVALYARAFVFSVDNFIKQLAVMADDPTSPQGVRDALDAFAQAVPGATAVRNSLHHLEDRNRGLKQGGRPITPQPINAHGIVAEGGATLFVTGTSIHGSTVFNTAADGSLGELDVSETTLQHMIDCMQAVIDAFTWDQSIDSEMRWPYS